MKGALVFMELILVYLSRVIVCIPFVCVEHVETIYGFTVGLIINIKNVIPASTIFRIST